MKSQLNQHNLYSIGDLLHILAIDFPDLSISKIRFLETEGLISPTRTSSGYRKFTEFDLNRIRYILQLQKDHYLPLRVIREHLDAIDQGTEHPIQTQTKESLSTKLKNLNISSFEDRSQFAANTFLTAQELADACMVDLSMIEELEQLKLISRIESKFKSVDMQVVKMVTTLGSLGVPVQHLKAIKLSVDREIALADTVTKPVRLRKVKQSENQAQDLKVEILNAFLELHIALLRAAKTNKL